MKNVMLAVSLFAVVAFAEDKEAHEKGETEQAEKAAPALSAALKEAKVTLAAGIRAAEKQGRPISAKFEVEDGKLQLSVYTMKGDKFSEVVVDHKTGKVAKTEPITEGDDLAAAKHQAEAMAKTKKALRSVVAAAEKANAGYKAVGITPELEDGAPQADVDLLKGSESKQVEEKL